MDKEPTRRRVIEGLFSTDEILAMNAEGMNAYYLPNGPKEYVPGTTVDGSLVDNFQWVFVDCDLKDGKYASKDAFIEALTNVPEPSLIVDSGHGVHAYWKVSDLDAMAYLRLSRRLIRALNTDEAVGQIFQLMRLPETLNTKQEHNFVLCETLHTSDTVYTCEQLDKALPPIAHNDEAYCQQHYDKTYNVDRKNLNIDDTLPPKFGALLVSNHEVKDIWAGGASDRSKNDYRLGHIMLAHGFTRDEAASVLVNSAKALGRLPVHRASYAENIIDKIWTFESATPEVKAQTSPTVRDILSKGEETVKGTRFPCNKLIDDTVHGFRLGQVIGIIGGSGVGKTTLTLNAFLWFAENNPEYHHFFFSLEQPIGEIASRIRTICGINDSLYDKIHIVSNYAESGEYRHMSIDMVQEHITTWQKETGLKAGAIVIDHIGVLEKSTKNGEADGLISICRKMKAVAQATNTMLIMLSQAPREKAGIGDLELDKSAAYGTVFFESFVDYCICLWQPLKRTYTQGAPTVMAVKFAKIRHKLQNKDRIKEDTCYQFFFDPETERVRELTQDEEKASEYWVKTATNLRKLDKKTDIVRYESRRVEEPSAKTDSNTQAVRH
jgi:KaiC/GvpD/RAD55 family RecA-like ATPase